VRLWEEEIREFLQNRVAYIQMIENNMANLFSGEFTQTNKTEIAEEIKNLKAASSKGNGYASFLLHLWHDPKLACPSAKLRDGILAVNAKSADWYRHLAFNQLKKAKDIQSLRTLALYYQGGWSPAKLDSNKAIECWQKAFEMGDFHGSGRELLEIYTTTKKHKNSEKAEEIRKILKANSAN
jgi:hypothetical protein